MTRKAGIIILTIGLICILGYASVWATYYFSMKKANQEALETGCKENIEQEFKGEIVEVERFEYDNFMHNHYFNLHIKVDNNANEYIDYHYNLKPNKNILSFVIKGQKVVKIKGTNTFTIIDSTGIKKSFKIAKCAEYE